MQIKCDEKHCEHHTSKGFCNAKTIHIVKRMCRSMVKLDIVGLMKAPFNSHCRRDKGKYVSQSPKKI